MTPPFQVESWIWYGVGMMVACCRLISRTIHANGLRNLMIDDWLMVVAMTTHTAFLVTINKEVNYNSNLIQPGENIHSFTTADVEERMYGSKLTVIVEQMQCCTIWLLKACLICLYHRVTEGSKSNVFIKALAIYVGTSFVVMEILYLGVWCHPFHDYWAVPTPNIQCSAAIDHLITNAVFNISSDVTLITIALSVSIRNRLSTSRKIILCFIFGLGLFTVLSAVLNKYYSFTHPFGPEWTFWYVRESSTALIVSNLPFTWSLLRRIFKLKPFSSPADGGEETAAEDQGPSSPATASSKTFRLTPLSGLDSPQTLPVAANHRRQRGLEDATQPDWRGAGVFGRQDAEALAADDWEHGRIVSDDRMDGVTLISEIGTVAWHDDQDPERTRRIGLLRDEETDMGLP